MSKVITNKKILLILPLFALFVSVALFLPTDSTPTAEADCPANGIHGQVNPACAGLYKTAAELTLTPGVIQRDASGNPTQTGCARDTDRHCSDHISGGNPGFPQQFTWENETYTIDTVRRTGNRLYVQFFVGNSGTKHENLKKLTLSVKPPFDTGVLLNLSDLTRSGTTTSATYDFDKSWGGNTCKAGTYQFADGTTSRHSPCATYNWEGQQVKLYLFEDLRIVCTVRQERTGSNQCNVSIPEHRDWAHYYGYCLDPENTWGTTCVDGQRNSHAREKTPSGRALPPGGTPPAAAQQAPPVTIISRPEQDPNPDPDPQPQRVEQPAESKSLIQQMYEWRNDPDYVSFKTHTDRWDRALLALGETVADATLTPMTAAEAQALADTDWGTRWIPVAKAIKFAEQPKQEEEPNQGGTLTPDPTPEPGDTQQPPDTNPPNNLQTPDPDPAQGAGPAQEPVQAQPQQQEPAQQQPVQPQLTEEPNEPEQGGQPLTEQPAQEPEQGQQHQQQPLTHTGGGSGDGANNRVVVARYVAPDALLSFDSERAAPGQTITITGSGFTGWAPLQSITIGGLEAWSGGWVITSPEGRFEAEIMVPGLPHGRQEVVVTVGGWTASSYLMVSAATEETHEPTTATEAFRGLGIFLDVVWHYDETTQTMKFYDPQMPGESTLAEMEDGEVYLVKVHGTVNAVLNGKPVTLSCVNGNCWNQIVW